MKKEFCGILSGLLAACVFCLAFLPLLPQNGYAASGLQEHAVNTGSDPIEVPDTEPDPIPEDPPVEVPDPPRAAASAADTGTDTGDNGSDPDTDKPVEPPVGSPLDTEN